MEASSQSLQAWHQLLVDADQARDCEWAHLRSVLEKVQSFPPTDQPQCLQALAAHLTVSCVKDWGKASAYGCKYCESPDL